MRLALRGDEDDLNAMLHRERRYAPWCGFVPMSDVELYGSEAYKFARQHGLENLMNMHPDTVESVLYLFDLFTATDEDFQGAEEPAFNLVFAVAVWIITKAHHSPDPLTLEGLVRTTGVDADVLKGMELCMMKTVDYKLYKPSVFGFIVAVADLLPERWYSDEDIHTLKYESFGVAHYVNLDPRFAFTRPLLVAVSILSNVAKFWCQCECDVMYVLDACGYDFPENIMPLISGDYVSMKSVIYDLMMFGLGPSYGEIQTE